jgi:hypothetical protein
MGKVHEQQTAQGDAIVWFFTPEEIARFSIPGAGEFSNAGRNYFRGPGGWGLNMSLAKRTKVIGEQILEVRADATNVLNHPIFGFPTAAPRPTPSASWPAISIAAPPTLTITDRLLATLTGRSWTTERSSGTVAACGISTSLSRRTRDGDPLIGAAAG